MKARFLVVSFLVVVGLLLSIPAAQAKTASCPCSPCKCSPCTCGGGGGSKSDAKHHEGEGKHHDKEHGHGHSGGVGVGVSVDLSGVGQRTPEANPFPVGGGEPVAHTQEKQKPKTKEKEVTKTDPFDEIKVTGKEAKGDIPSGQINVSDDNVTPAGSPPSETSSQPNSPTMDDLKKAADSFKAAKKKFLRADPDWDKAMKLESGPRKQADEGLKLASSVLRKFLLSDEGKKLLDDWMKVYQALNKPGAGIPFDLVPEDELEEAKYKLSRAQDQVEEKRKDYDELKNKAVANNNGVKNIQAEIDKLKSTAHFSEKDAQADRDKVKQLEKDLDNAKKHAANDWASSDDAKKQMKGIQEAEKDLDKAKADFKPYEGMEKNPLKSAGNP